MRMPPLPADSIHARACKLKCEKILTRPWGNYVYQRSPIFFTSFQQSQSAGKLSFGGNSAVFFQISVRGYYSLDAIFFCCGNSPPHCRSPPRSEFSKIQNEWWKKQWMAVIQKTLTLVPSAGGMKKTLMKYTPLASILPTHATFWHLRTATR